MSLYSLVSPFNKRQKKEIEMGNLGINRFGQSHGDDMNLMAPGKFISYDTLIQSMDDGTDLGYGVKESYWVDVEECDGDLNDQPYSYSMEDFEEDPAHEPEQTPGCDGEEVDSGPDPYFMFSETLIIGDDESDFNPQGGTSGIGRTINATLSHEELKRKDKRDRSPKDHARRKWNKRDTVRGKISATD